jgi:hypothetical protein
MTRDRWLETLTSIVDRFPVLNRGEEPLDGEPGKVEFVEFTGPAGDIRLEFVTRPRIVGKKALGGRRVGTAASVSYQYSPDEEVHELTALRRVNGVWQEVDASSFLT